MRSGSVPLLGAACVVVAFAAALVASPHEAQAMREYAKKEGKECAFCHLSEKGGGPRTAKGREYEANGHQFGVKSWTSDANEQKYLRASSAVVAQWYVEATRLLDAVHADEKLPGGLALESAIREKFRMFPRAWLGAAKKLLGKGSAGVPNALVFLTKLESQFAASDEGREAATLLGDLAKDAKTTDAVLSARRTERIRALLLEGRTEFQLGRADAARALFEKALADPAAGPIETELREALAALTPPK